MSRQAAMKPPLTNWHAPVAAGDLQAMSELGHRLLTGDQVPRLPEQGVSLIQEAARGGEGRALARVAALTAAGAYLPQDWPAAMRLLGAAAAAGDEPASGQILSLQPADSQLDPRTGWPSLAARIRLEEWLRPAVITPLHAKVAPRAATGASSGSARG